MAFAFIPSVYSHFTFIQTHKQNLVDRKEQKEFEMLETISIEGTIIYTE